MKTGDTVRHKPTGERWTVAYVDRDRLAWCGWPPGEARVEDCDLVTECSEEQSLALLRDLAKTRQNSDRGHDRRQSFAQSRLAELKLRRKLEAPAERISLEDVPPWSLRRGDIVCNKGDGNSYVVEATGHSPVAIRTVQICNMAEWELVRYVEEPSR